MMTTYCYFCGFELGKVTWDKQQQKEHRQRYVDHLTKEHTFDELANVIFWTTEKGGLQRRAITA
jgi:hypothetical protein